MATLPVFNRLDYLVNRRNEAKKTDINWQNTRTGALVRQCDSEIDEIVERIKV